MTSLTACSSPFGRFPNVRGKTKEPGNKLDRLTAKYHRPKSIAIARLCLAQPFYAFTNNLKYFHKKCQHMGNAMTSQQPVRQTASQPAGQLGPVQSSPAAVAVTVTVVAVARSSRSSGWQSKPTAKKLSSQK